ncbi:hypothetical protein E0H26_14485 [Micromonospora zingiberis]|uniref:Uncharacterized protein n=1 Tax=Micromonospora zingiberis TaxID=2053011 RepID=A0A4R0GJ66_9ACTN|nr:permease prefix domain 1-containing protein [Micromonospora zingiberis]TCB96817.1 hypothetical protein E0H26_14485 [Micromonospora zingiberis]
MTTHATLDVHRLLDEAFAGIEMSPDRQDLKEEIRANLVARVGELVDTGHSPATAARQAITELGDLRPLLDAAPAASAPSAHAEWERHRVRPTPGFLVRTALLAALGVAGLALLVLATAGTAVPSGWLLVAVTAVAVAAGAGTADALRQETSSSYPMPATRAGGYGLAVTLALAGLGAGWSYLTSGGLPSLPVGAVAVVAAVVLFAYLGGTQTNRHKPWMLRLAANHHDIANRFTEDPASAARFGLYTATIWLVAIAAFAVLSVTVGWAWSWLALLGAIVVMLVLLARMQFPHHPPPQPPPNPPTPRPPPPRPALALVDQGVCVSAQATQRPKLLDQPERRGGPERGWGEVRGEVGVGSVSRILVRNGPRGGLMGAVSNQDPRLGSGEADRVARRCRLGGRPAVVGRTVD